MSLNLLLHCALKQALISEANLQLIKKKRFIPQPAILYRTPPCDHIWTHGLSSRLQALSISLTIYLVLLGEGLVLQNCHRHQGNNRYDANHSDDDGHRPVPGVLLFHVWERGRKERQTGSRGERVTGGVEPWRWGHIETEREKSVSQVLDPDVCDVTACVCIQYSVLEYYSVTKDYRWVFRYLKNVNWFQELFQLPLVLVSSNTYKNTHTLAE